MARGNILWSPYDKKNVDSINANTLRFAIVVRSGKGNKDE